MNAEFDRDWRRWHRERVTSVTSPHGPAALVLSYWLNETAGHVDGLPGSWRKADGAAIGEGLGGVPLRPAEGPERLGERWRIGEGDILFLGDRALRVFVRDDEVALRVFDPGNPPLRTLEGIETFPPDPSWVVRGVYLPAEAEASLAVVETVDGRSRVSTIGGTVEFSHPDGSPLRLVVHESPEGLHAVFSDTTSGSESYRFRFLDLPLPNPDGTVAVDLNRAHLPPCAFSDHFACPFPDPRNRLSAAIRAGERAILRTGVRVEIGGLAAAHEADQAKGR